MTDTTQIEAFAALNHIENGDWDRFLLRLRGAIELRRATDEYEQHIVVGPVIPRPEGRSVRKPRPTAPEHTHDGVRLDKAIKPQEPAMSDPYPKYNPLARAYWTVPASQGAIGDEQRQPAPVADTGPCPHDCAVGIGHVTTVTPEWTGVIWECTVCHAIGEDTEDNQAIIWAEVDE